MEYVMDIFGGFRSHGGIPISSKSWMTFWSIETQGLLGKPSPGSTTRHHPPTPCATTAHGRRGGHRPCSTAGGPGKVHGPHGGWTTGGKALPGGFRGSLGCFFFDFMVLLKGFNKQKDNVLSRFRCQQLRVLSRLDMENTSTLLENTWTYWNIHQHRTLNLHQISRNWPQTLKSRVLEWHVELASGGMARIIVESPGLRHQRGANMPFQHIPMVQHMVNN